MNRLTLRTLRVSLLAATLSVVGCETGSAPDGPTGNTGVAPGTIGDGSSHNVAAPAPSVATAGVDAFDAALARGIADSAQRLAVLQQRWSAVQRAVASAGVDHEGAFYATRGYWHTGFLRGGGWSWQEAGDLDQPIVVDGRGNVLIQGNCNGDITLTGDAVVHILGDLNATITLQGTGEIIIAGSINPAGSIASSGTLDLYTGGGVAGRITVGGSGVLVIDGPLIGNLTAGQPVTALHITGDCIGQITAPPNAAALLTLRVDGFMPQTALQATLDSGFTRFTAAIATSNTQPGLYPARTEDGNNTRPTSRWVIHQRTQR